MGILSSLRTRDDVAEVLSALAISHGMDRSRVGIHEVENPDKEGRGSSWLALFLHTEEFQVELKIYGVSFFQAIVWRPFMGQQKPVSLVFRDQAGLEKFFEESLIRGAWWGKLAP